MNVEALPISETSGSARLSRPFLLLAGIVTAMAAGLLVYSQTMAYAQDEGFHLLTAQLIAAGKRPYLDFFFPQTSLNAYWNALWFRIFGDTWRTAHAVAALLTSGATLLTADYVLERFPVPRWRLAAALSTVALLGLNIAVVQFCPLGQAYGTALFLSVAAFRLAVLTVDRRSLLLAACAGFFASAAPGSTLLTAPLPAVLLLWMLIRNRAGSRALKTAAFLAGGAIAVSPMLWLFIQSPQQVLFNVVKFHLYYRQVEWSGALEHDAGVWGAWLDSSQVTLTLLLAVAGLTYVYRKSDWDRARRWEMYLCSWIAVALSVHISTAHPTFERYYLFTLPYLAILGSTGLYFVAARLYRADRPFWPAFLLTLLLALGLAKTLFSSHDDMRWRDYEKISKKIAEVAPGNTPVVADEHFYFITRRRPPEGMEHEDSHKLTLSPAEAKALHVVSEADLAKRIQAGEFSAVETCSDEDGYKKMGLPGPYKHKEEISDCSIFWK
jgi:hypothetical protein